MPKKSRKKRKRLKKLMAALRLPTDDEVLAEQEACFHSSHELCDSSVSDPNDIPIVCDRKWGHDLDHIAIRTFNGETWRYEWSDDEEELDEEKVPWPSDEAVEEAIHNHMMAIAGKD